VALLRLRAEFLFERERCVREELWPQVRDLGRGVADVDELLSTCRVRGTLPRPGKERKTRTVRSTKRRQDALKLPRRPMENRTVCRVYRSKTGMEHRPSMLLTVTLPGFGAIHTARGCGAANSSRALAASSTARMTACWERRWTQTSTTIGSRRSP
jgi:hypothetical protein